MAGGVGRRRSVAPSVQLVAWGRGGSVGEAAPRWGRERAPRTTGRGNRGRAQVENMVLRSPEPPTPSTTSLPMGKTLPQGQATEANRPAQTNTTEMLTGPGKAGGHASSFPARRPEALPASRPLPSTGCGLDPPPTPGKGATLPAPGCLAGTPHAALVGAANRKPRGRSTAR